MRLTVILHHDPRARTHRLIDHFVYHDGDLSTVFDEMLPAVQAAVLAYFHDYSHKHTRINGWETPAKRAERARWEYDRIIWEDWSTRGEAYDPASDIVIKVLNFDHDWLGEEERINEGIFKGIHDLTDEQFRSTDWQPLFKIWVAGR